MTITMPTWGYWSSWRGSGCCLG